MENNTQKLNLIAYCGLYCANCGKLKKGKCPGCEENTKASWCTIRSCCIDKNISSCAQCNEFTKTGDCKKFNNVFSKVIQFVSRTDRELCINMIKEHGRDEFIRHMTQCGMMSLPKTKN